jgi:hypothetical protein
MIKIENYQEITNEVSYYIVTLKYDQDFPLLKMNFDIDSEEIEVEGIRFVVNDCLVSDNGESINLVCDKVDVLNILQLSAIAQDYYENLRSRSMLHGWDKYVATDGEHCMFVHSDYEPRRNEAVFFLTTRNKFTSVQLHKQWQQ